jgi:rod shape-determining protein MreB
VSELEAERAKVSSATEENGPLVVHGRDGGSGRARLATIQPAEVALAVRPIVSEVVRALTACLDDLPPQGLADVLAEGVLVFGGASLVHGFPEQLESELGLPVKLAEEPLTCVADGAARALRNRALLKAYGRS